jgi:hypothetical protein
VGSSEAVYEAAAENFLAALAEADSEARLDSLIDVLRRTESEFAKLTVTNERNPVLAGIIGEPFVRFSSILNKNLPERLGEFGGPAADGSF